MGLLCASRFGVTFFFRLCLLLAVLSVAACGNDGTFRINGKIDNFGTGNLRVVYFSRGAVQSVVAPAVDGKFSMTGFADRGTIARIYTGKGVVVGRLAVSPGDMIDVELDISDPSVMKVDGSEDSGRLAGFLGENAPLLKSGESAALNNAVAAYVGQHPSDVVSGILMSDFFMAGGHERQYLELLESLDAKVLAMASLEGMVPVARVAALPPDSLRLDPVSLFALSDTVEEVDAARHAVTFLMFTDAGSRESDSIGAALTVLRPVAGKGALEIVDVSCDADTSVWHGSLERLRERADSVGKGKAGAEEFYSVRRYWSPAPFNLIGMGEIGVGQVPWFVVADSTRRVLYKGPSVAVARDAAMR